MNFVFLLLFGLPEDASPSPEEYMQNLQAWFEDARKFSWERIHMTMKKMKTKYEMKTMRHKFNEGDKFLLRNRVSRKGRSPKLQLS